MKSPILPASALALLAIPFSHATEPGWAEVENQFGTLPMAARRLTGPLFRMHGDETRAQLASELQKVLEGRNGTFTAE
ncbi:MAG: hypothetical protein NTW21_16905 [Verrucomicrobia bacterium]|nr:hypothetical protein [Verrucomicrobiota bacterium]